jgi:hypothetical protein
MPLGVCGVSTLQGNPEGGSPESLLVRPLLLSPAAGTGAVAAATASFPAEAFTASATKHPFSSAAARCGSGGEGEEGPFAAAGGGALAAAGVAAFVGEAGDMVAGNWAFPPAAGSALAAAGDADGTAARAGDAGAGAVGLAPGALHWKGAFGF